MNRPLLLVLVCGCLTAAPAGERDRTDEGFTAAAAVADRAREAAGPEVNSGPQGGGTSPPSPGPVGRDLVVGRASGGCPITVLRDVSGAVARSVADWFEDRPSVMHFIPLVERVKVRLGRSTADLAPHFEAAAAAFPDGAEIRVPTGLYHVSLAKITGRRLTFALDDSTTIRKHGPAGGAVRGVFQVANLLGADFTLRGGTVDLNGEGPKGIGVAGRIANTYASNTIPAIRGISGPGNAAVFALRASQIRVEGVTIKNSGENGLLFRNCSDVVVEGCRFSNISNWAVEFSFVDDGSDGGTGAMPDRSRCSVRYCDFEDINDYAMGSGNGGAVGGGGAGGLGVFHDYSVIGCSIRNCYRGVHFEFQSGSHIDGIDVTGFDMREIGQNGVGLVGARRALIQGRMVNVGQATAAALTYQAAATYPDISGVVLSSDFDHVTVRNLMLSDTRRGGVAYRADGVARAGDATFNSAGANFTGDDVGKPIGILGAGPSGIVHETTIAARISATSVELADAPVSSVAAGAKFAYGGATREGIIAYSGTAVDVEGCTIEAGVFSGLADEPHAAAVRLQALTGRARVADSVLRAPANGGTRPYGIRLADAFAGELIVEPTNRITGFAEASAGVRAGAVHEQQR